MRYTVASIVACVLAMPAIGSDPGHPLDCSDFVFLEPGLTCRVVLDPCTTTACYNIMEHAADPSGGLLDAEAVPPGLPACGPTGPTPDVRVNIVRFRDGVPSIVAYVQSRCGITGCLDRVSMVAENRGSSGFEPNYGRLYLGLDTNGGQPSPTCSPTYSQRRLFVIEGFSTTFDVLQSFAPAASLGFRVPYMPEGLPGADHFDTYYGPLTKPLDFTKAQPLACGYPSSPPSAGDFEVVADTLPDPAPGTGRYYITSVTYQGATRDGRQTISGHLTGRDPALLPACIQPSN